MCREISSVWETLVNTRTQACQTKFVEFIDGMTVMSTGLTVITIIAFILAVIATWPRLRLLLWTYLPGWVPLYRRPSLLILEVWPESGGSRVSGYTWGQQV